VRWAISQGAHPLAPKISPLLPESDSSSTVKGCGGLLYATLNCGDEICPPQGGGLNLRFGKSRILIHSARHAPSVPSLADRAGTVWHGACRAPQSSLCNRQDRHGEDAAHSINDRAGSFERTRSWSYRPSWGSGLGNPGCRPPQPSQSPFPRPSPQGTPAAPVQHQPQPRSAVRRLAPGRSGGAPARRGGLRGAGWPAARTLGDSRGCAPADAKRALEFLSAGEPTSDQGR